MEYLVRWTHSFWVWNSYVLFGGKTELRVQTDAEREGGCCQGWWKECVVGSGTFTPSGGNRRVRFTPSSDQSGATYCPIRQLLSKGVSWCWHLSLHLQGWRQRCWVAHVHTSDKPTEIRLAGSHLNWHSVGINMGSSSCSSDLSLIIHLFIYILIHLIYLIYSSIWMPHPADKFNSSMFSHLAFPITPSFLKLSHSLSLPVHPPHPSLWEEVFSR